MMNRLFRYLCCILYISSSLWLGTASAEAKWWQIFHRHHNDDPTQEDQLPQPAGAGSTSTGAPYSPGVPATSLTAPSAAPAYSRSLPSNNGSSPTGQASVPSLEPPPLPDRPPIPNPPAISCPAPLGSGVAKPALAWRAKSLRQLNIPVGVGTAAQSFGTSEVYLAATPAAAPAMTAARTYNEVASTYTGGLCLSKTFAAKFDDTFMAAVLALSQSGLSIRSMDSTHGKLEATSSDPHSQTSVSLQLNHDLLDTTSVNCYCNAANAASKVLSANVLSNITTSLGGQSK
jgi:hypothetical protein